MPKKRMVIVGSVVGGALLLMLFCCGGSAGVWWLASSRIAKADKDQPAKVAGIGIGGLVEGKGELVVSKPEPQPKEQPKEAPKQEPSKPEPKQQPKQENTIQLERLTDLAEAYKKNPVAFNGKYKGNLVSGPWNLYGKLDEQKGGFVWLVQCAHNIDTDQKDYAIECKLSAEGQKQYSEGVKGLLNMRLVGRVIDTRPYDGWIFNRAIIMDGCHWTK